MSNTFKSAVQSNAKIKNPKSARTTNGMKARASTANANVDLFFQIGAARGKDVTAMFETAFREDRLTALKILAWSRDVRGGAGERQIFRDVLSYVEVYHPSELAQLVKLAPHYGRWDDILHLDTDLGRDLAFAEIKEALMVKNNGLCAKWMPRKGAVAVALTKYLGLTPKGYRKLIVGLTKVVETQMCANDWGNINYEHVPSLAAARYQKAFGRHDAIGYSAYKSKLGAGTAKINAEAVYPYDVIKSIQNGDKVVGKAQWDALPNFIGDELVLPMVDVSGSMTCRVGGNMNSALTCMDVAVSLGLYLADKNSGPFKDMFMNFSSEAKIEVLKGDIVQKLNQLKRSHWGMSTDLHAAFKEVLRVATQNSVPADQMPRYILIMSDMQFNQCVQHDDSAIEMIRRKYADAGYEMPNIVFWNLNAHMGNVPVKHNEEGVALISGFSPSIVKSVLAADALTPDSIMRQTIDQARYDLVK